MQSNVSPRDGEGKAVLRAQRIREAAIIHIVRHDGADLDRLLRWRLVG